MDFEALLAHSSWVRSLAKNLVFDQAEVDDVIQTAWLAALKKPPQQRTNLRGWLRTVLLNKARETGRSKARRSRREQVVAREEKLPSTIEVVEHADLHRKLVNIVMELPEPFRSTLLLHYFEDQSFKEIASQLGVPETTVRTRLKRGLDRLRERFDQEYKGDRQAWCLALIPLAVPKKVAAAAGVSVWLSLQAKLAIAALFLLAGFLGYQFWKTDPRTPELARATETKPSATGNAPATSENKKESSESSATPLANEAAEGSRKLADLNLDKAIKIENTAILSGRVSVNGLTPTESIPFQISDANGEKKRALQTDAAGNFYVENLPQNWKGLISFSRPYYLTNEANEILSGVPLSSPKQEISLELKRCPTITGRVLNTKGEPTEAILICVANGVLHTTKPIRNPDNSSSKVSAPLYGDESVTSFEGKFRLFFAPGEAIQNIRIRLNHYGNVESKTISIPELKPTQDLDLGDISLESAKRLIVRVVDAENDKPIPGAFITLTEQTKKAVISAPPETILYLTMQTNEQGLTAIMDPPADLEKLFAYVGGFQSGGMQMPKNVFENIPSHLSPQVTFRLLRGANQLEIRPLQPATSIETDIVICIESSDYVFGPDLQTRDVSTMIVKTRSIDPKQTSRINFFPASKGGLPLFRALTPGVPFRLEIRDALGFSLLLQNEVVLAHLENKVIELPLPAKARLFTGKVLDSEGKPMLGATVQGFLEGNDFLQTSFSENLPKYQADAKGEFTIPTYANQASFRIQKEGFETLEIHNFAIPENGVSKEFTLKRAK